MEDPTYIHIIQQYPTYIPYNPTYIYRLNYVKFLNPTYFTSQHSQIWSLSLQWCSSWSQLLEHRFDTFDHSLRFKALLKTQNCTRATIGAHHNPTTGPKFHPGALQKLLRYEALFSSMSDSCFQELSISHQIAQKGLMTASSGTSLTSSFSFSTWGKLLNSTRQLFLSRLQ